MSETIGIINERHNFIIAIRCYNPSQKLINNFNHFSRQILPSKLMKLSRYHIWLTNKIRRSLNRDISNSVKDF